MAAARRAVERRERFWKFVLFISAIGFPCAMFVLGELGFYITDPRAFIAFVVHIGLIVLAMAKLM